jgi:hypothetical protein
LKIFRALPPVKEDRSAVMNKKKFDFESFDISTMSSSPDTDCEDYIPPRLSLCYSIDAINPGRTRILPSPFCTISRRSEEVLGLSHGSRPSTPNADEEEEEACVYSCSSSGSRTASPTPLADSGVEISGVHSLAAVDPEEAVYHRFEDESETTTDTSGDMIQCNVCFELVYEYEYDQAVCACIDCADNICGGASCSISVDVDDQNAVCEYCMVVLCEECRVGHAKRCSLNPYKISRDKDRVAEALRIAIG